MAEMLKTEEMTEPQKDDTPSTSGQKSSQTHGLDGVIIKVANAISDDGDLMKLGIELGVQIHDINRALETNWAGGRKTSNGNLMLLQNWVETVTLSKRLPILRAALKKVGLLEVEEPCFTSRCSGDDEAMPSDIMKLREQLKSRYRKKFGQVKTSPVDSESRTWLQHIYVSLVLMLGFGGEQEEPIDYDGLFKFIKTETPKGFVTRLALIGEAGAGKSTLFAKIALDWAEGKILQEINLLFLESFREIKESGFFGDTVMGHFPDDSEIKAERVDEYIRKNQKKVFILLDGLDEANIDIKKPNHNDAIVSIVRGERFIDTPVVITTRPYGADQIKSTMTINDHYTFVKVKGFTKENMATYIRNFFNDDSDSASSLIEFINTNHVVSEYMAPFPIFCSMLCCLWKTPSGREYIQTMKTFSQLLKRLVFSLQELYFSKHNELEEGYRNCMKKAGESMKKIGSVAFQGLLVNQFIFDEIALGSCTEATMTACEVGILSKEKRLAPLQIRESQGKLYVQEFSFPHKLLQEYIASLYVASLFHQDRLEFNRILTETLLEDYEEFRYVLYFTAAHGGEVGKSILEALCKKVDDVNFILEVAFECHDSEAIDPVRNLLEAKAYLEICYVDPIATYLFTLETIGKEVVRRSSSIRETLGVSKPFEANASSSHVAAVGLFTLQNLRMLVFESVRLDDEFYTGMSAAASQSKIDELKHMNADLGSAASTHYARGLCFMPNIRLLEMYAIKLSDEFYSTMASEAPKSNIEELMHCYADLGSAASSHYAKGLCLMSNLRSLTFAYMKLSDEFYSTMASEASKSKIEKLTLIHLDLGSHASSHYAKGLCFMSNLRSLYLKKLKLSDEFYSTIASEASKSKIEDLRHDFADLGSAASSLYARGLCLMPNLRSLYLDCVELSDEFYSTMASEASKSKIQTLNIWSVSMMTSRRLHSILSLPRLQSLTLRDIRRVDMEDGETLIPSSVDKLSVDGEHVASLWYLGLHTSCPLVKTLKLDCSSRENVSSDIVTMACSPFHHLTHLHIEGDLDDHVSFSKAVKTSCPRLTKLSITRIGLFNKKAAEIIQFMRTHPNLTSIALNECDTNADLDPLISDLNSEGKLTVTVTHG